MKIHTGDIVQLISGKHKGKSGKVLKINKDRVLVEGANIVKRAMKKQGGQPGQFVESERAVHISSVAILDPKTKKPTRIGYRMENGKKVRFAKSSSTSL